MKVKVTYSCPSCQYRYTEEIEIYPDKKVTLDCKSCEEPEVLVIEAGKPNGMPLR